MDHRHRERQALPKPKRQVAGLLAHVLLQAEAGHQIGKAFPGARRPKMVEPRVKDKVLMDREFAVKREGLRHEAHAGPRFHPLIGNGLAEDPRLSLGRGQKTGQHLHSRGLAAAVRAEKAEDFASGDVKAD